MNLKPFFKISLRRNHFKWGSDALSESNWRSRTWKNLPSSSVFWMCVFSGTKGDSGQVGAGRAASAGHPVLQAAESIAQQASARVRCPEDESPQAVQYSNKTSLLLLVMANSTQCHCCEQMWIKNYLWTENQTSNTSPILYLLYC